jgi:uncharacterized membrane protein YiaA
MVDSIRIIAKAVLFAVSLVVAVVSYLVGWMQTEQHITWQYVAVTALVAAGALALNMYKDVREELRELRRDLHKKQDKD